MKRFMLIARPRLDHVRLPAALVLGALVFGVACSGGETPASTPEPTSTAVPATPTPEPTATPTPIPSPTSVPTPEPTAAPISASMAQLVAAASPSIAIVASSPDRGSAFVIDEKGLLLTSSGLVRGVDSVRVILSTGEEVNATVVGRDEFMGIALLQVSVGRALPALRLAEPATVTAALDVVAMGYTRSAAIASAFSFARGYVVSQNQVGSLRFIQTDAVFDAGLVGGPLFNFNGDVVGLNTMRVETSSTTAIQGNGLAIHTASLATQLERLAQGAQFFKPTRPEDIIPADTTPPVPPFPNLFWGTITVNGSPAPDGVQVYARIGRYVSEPVITKDGRYPFLTVGPPVEEGFTGREITFYVDGFAVPQKGAYNPNVNDPIVDLNLTATTSP